MSKTFARLIANGLVKFYCCYVDDSLPVVKDVDYIHSLLNKFNKNLSFTVVVFDNKIPKFFDLEI